PTLSLANNLWIGRIPWEVNVLSFAEQLLVSLLYTRVYVFKLFPKKFRGVWNAPTDGFQRSMCGNVSTYELDMTGIVSMLEGNLMPRPPAVLASVISVTFIGLGKLPKNWLRNTFKVRRAVVGSALQWFKQHNKKYYADIEIHPSRLAALPVDDVPDEI
ncbi:hypothetical protein ARMSODRAFT_852135, partial [Armillaria solidipes]